VERDKYEVFEMPNCAVMVGVEVQPEIQTFYVHVLCCIIEKFMTGSILGLFLHFYCIKKSECKI
jgi:hypothetical protein